jgi:hypothetical protein
MDLEQQTSPDPSQSCGQKRSSAEIQLLVFWRLEEMENPSYEGMIPHSFHEPSFDGSLKPNVIALWGQFDSQFQQKKHSEGRHA